MNPPNLNRESVIFRILLSILITHFFPLFLDRRNKWFFSSFDFHCTSQVDLMHSIMLRSANQKSVNEIRIQKKQEEKERKILYTHQFTFVCSAFSVFFWRKKSIHIQRARLPHENVGHEVNFCCFYRKWKRSIFIDVVEDTYNFDLFIQRSHFTQYTDTNTHTYTTENRHTSITSQRTHKISAHLHVFSFWFMLLFDFWFPSSAAHFFSVSDFSVCLFECARLQQANAETCKEVFFLSLSLSLQMPSWYYHFQTSIIDD